MGKPTLLHCNYAATAAVTATDTYSGYDADDVLHPTEDLGWRPANNSGLKRLDLDLASSHTADTVALLGENMAALDFAFYPADASGNPDYTAGLAESLAIMGNDSDNIDFTGGLGDWVVGANAVLTNPSGRLRITGNGGDFPSAQINITGLTVGKRYCIWVQNAYIGTATQMFITLRDAANSVDEAYSVFISADGEMHLFFTADETSKWIGVRQSDLASTNYIEIDNIHVFEAGQVPSTVVNAAWLRTESGASRYWSLLLGDVSSSLEINHVCLHDTTELPYLETDWLPDNLDVSGEFLLSGAGYCTGGTVEKAMREMRIHPGQLTEADFADYAAWAEECIRGMRPFFLVPDVDESDVFFGWIPDGRFDAPRPEGVRDVSAMTFVTRAA